MPNLKQSSHFVPQSDLFVTEPDQTLRDVYRALSEASRTGGFVVRGHGSKPKYVRADKLAKAIERTVGANLRDWKRFSATPIGELITRFPASEILVDVDD